MTTASSSAHSRSSRWSLGALFAVYAVHVALANYFVPLRAVFSRRPLQGDDLDLHIGQVFRVLEGLEGWGKTWVYDVKLLAGQPEGTITDSGSKGWELWTYALHALGVDRATAFNSFVLFAMLAGPWVVFLAARLFGLSRFAAACAAAMTSSIWFFDSFAHWLWWVGMEAYSSASYLCLLTLAFFHRFLESQRKGFGLASALGLGAVLLVHPYSFFILCLPMAALYLRARRGFGPRGHASVIAIALFALAVNAYWLRVAAAHWHYILNSAFYGQGGLRYLAMDFIEQLREVTDTGVIGTRSGFRLLYFGLAFGGLMLWRSRGDRLFLPFALGLAMLLAFAYLGPAIPGAGQVQPYRHMLPSCFFATLPAATMVETLVLERAFAKLARPLGLALAALALVVAQHLTTEVLYFLPDATRETGPLPDDTPSPISKYGFFMAGHQRSHVLYALPHSTWLESNADGVAAWVAEHVPPGERILVDNPVLGERIAWKTEAEVMGGFLERNIAHAYANYFRRRREDRIPEAELGEYLHTFAIRMVITQNRYPEFDAARELLQPYATVAGRQVYLTRAPGSKVLQGRALVRGRTNRIDVSASDPNQDLLLSYHYHEALRCEPGCRVERADVKLDRVGLVRVPAPHPVELRIVNRY